MFDKLCDHHKVQKVETAGDCYIVAGESYEDVVGQSLMQPSSLIGGSIPTISAGLLLLQLVIN